MLEDNCNWSGVTAAEKKVKALSIYGGKRVRDLVDSLRELEMEGDAFDKTMAKLNAFLLPKKNTDVLVARFRKMRQNDYETIMQYYAHLRPEAVKCEIKSHCLRKLGRVKRWGSADFLQINTI